MCCARTAALQGVYEKQKVNASNAARARCVRHAMPNTLAARFVLDFAWKRGTSDVPKS